MILVHRARWMPTSICKAVCQAQCAMRQGQFAISELIHLSCALCIAFATHTLLKCGADQRPVRCHRSVDCGRFYWQTGSQMKQSVSEPFLRLTSRLYWGWPACRYPFVRSAAEYMQRKQASVCGFYLRRKTVPVRSRSSLLVQSLHFVHIASAMDRS